MGPTYTSQDVSFFIFDYNTSTHLINLGKGTAVIAPKTIGTEPNIVFFVFDYSPNVPESFAVFIGKSGKCFSIINDDITPCAKPNFPVLS